MIMYFWAACWLFPLCYSRLFLPLHGPALQPEAGLQCSSHSVPFVLWLQVRLGQWEEMANYNMEKWRRDGPRIFYSCLYSEAPGPTVHSLFLFHIWPSRLMVRAAQFVQVPLQLALMLTISL